MMCRHFQEFDIQSFGGLKYHPISGYRTLGHQGREGWDWRGTCFFVGKHDLEMTFDKSLDLSPGQYYFGSFLQHVFLFTVAAKK